MKTSDLHTHTKYSCDSKALMEDYCERAIENEVHTICFTDHVDYNENDIGYRYYDPEAYFRDFEVIRDRYKGRLELLSGIEFSEPHLYGKELERLSKYPYDFILGSIHMFYNDMFPSEMVKRGFPAEICFMHYWDEVLKMVRYGGIDCVGHLDFPKRYFKELVYEDEKLVEIIRCMLDNEIYPEVNTSCFRNGLEASMPDRDILSIYKALGGVYVTIGSDAHSAEELAADFPYARALIDSLGLKEVVFRQRKRMEPARK